MNPGAWSPDEKAQELRTKAQQFLRDEKLARKRLKMLSLDYARVGSKRASEFYSHKPRQR
jgi:hypothetical protein